MSELTPTVEESICQKWDDVCSAANSRLKDGEAFVRDEPMKAVGYALAIGYVLRMLPVLSIFSLFLRFLVTLLKPAALVYGAAKAYELTTKPTDDAQSSLELGSNP